MLRSTNYSEIPTGRTIEPVEAMEVRAQLRLDHTEDDAELEDMIAEARRECETVKLGDRATISGTCIDYFDQFTDAMELHWSRVSGTPAVTYVDTNGTTQTLATSVYELGTVNGMGVLRLKYDQSWPSTRSHPDVIAVTYTAGYGTTKAAVPLPIRRWIKARAAWLYENRDGPAEEWSPLMDGLLSPFATARVYGSD